MLKTIGTIHFVPMVFYFPSIKPYLEQSTTPPKKDHAVFFRRILLKNAIFKQVTKSNAKFLYVFNW